MRNYKHIDRYLNELLGDVYPQLPDEEHTNLAQYVITNWVANLRPCESVLDVGCGSGFAQPMFEMLGIRYTGVCLGADYRRAKSSGRNVYKEDFHFLSHDDGAFDLVFARHALEHSVMPLLALMEWHRVAKNWLCVILPNPKEWGWGGRNHYSIMSANQARFLLNRAGWKTIWEDMSCSKELRFMCEKVEFRNMGMDDRFESYDDDDDDVDANEPEN